MIDQLDRTLRAAGIPARFLDRRFESFDVPRSSPSIGAAYKAMCAQADAERPASVLLFGSTGIGKTHLCVATIARRAERWLAKYPEATWQAADGRMTMRPPFSDLFIGVPDLLDRMRTWVVNHDGPDPLRDYEEAGLLVLDDLGREKVTDWASERLYLLVNRRYEAILPTIATSNYDLKELVAHGYDAVISRLHEGGGEWLPITGSDHR